MTPFNKTTIFAVTYLILSLSAWVFALITIMVTPNKSEFAGIYVVVLTIPWSFITVAVLDYFRLYNDTLRLVATAFGLIINTALILLICGYFKKSGRTKGADLRN